MLRLFSSTIAGLLLAQALGLQAQPTAEVTADGSQGPVAATDTQALILGVGLLPAGNTGDNGDWWLVDLTPENEWMYYRFPDQWSNVGQDWTQMAPGHQGPLVEVTDLPLNSPRYLSPGTHQFFFGVDLLMNGQLDLDRVYYDGVRVDVSATDTGRLSHTDLSYQGAFRLPDAFNWGARGMSYYPGGNRGAGSLMITAFQGLMTASGEACYEGVTGCEAYFGEVAIPTPASAASWEPLPVAPLLRPPTAFDGGAVAEVDEAYTFVAGIEYVPQQGSQTGDKLYGGLNVWYPEGLFGDASFPTVWISNLDGSNPRGPFHVGPASDPVYHGRKMGEYLFRVPQWYADRYLGGRTLVTGRSRGTPLSGEDPTAGGSQGPTLFAFRPWQTDTPSGELDALAMLYYRARYPECAGPDIGVGGAFVSCDYPGFSMCDDWTGASFVAAGENRAVMILGHKGCTNCYYCDETAADPECHATPLPGECDRFCDEGRGFHCGPYRRQVIFYDVDELGQAALGERMPWTPLPYETWEPTEFYLEPVDGNTCGDLGGMAFDSVGGRLFMVERGFGGYAGDNAAVVHVWSVGGD